jgi:hypothetical protein
VSYPGGPPPSYAVNVQTDAKDHNPGLTFLGMSGGILALVVALMILLPVLGCIGCCLFGGIGSVLAPDPLTTPTWGPTP